MQRIREAAARHPRVVDGGLALLVALLLLPATVERGDCSGAGWLWYAAYHAPLVWRRRAPLIVFALYLVLVAASDLLGITGAFQVTATLVAIYTVARHRPQWHLWPAAAAMELVVVLAALQAGRSVEVLITGTASTAAAVLLGIAARTRQALAAERDRRLAQEHDQRVRLAVAAERARIAREMHDIVTHNLAVMVALADGVGYAAESRPDRATEAIVQISATGREALAEARRLVGLLRDGEAPADPNRRAPQPGLDDLDRLVDQVRAAGVRVEVTHEGVPGDWGPGAGLAVYRIVQEALTNTLKHAGPYATVRVRLGYVPTGVDLEVTDDGAGQPARAATPSEGHGLAGMAERAAWYGGRVEAGPTDDTGWRVGAWLRFDEASLR